MVVWYDDRMNQPAPYAGDRGAISGRVVQPAATAGPQQSAVYKVGEFLKTLAHKAGVFANESDLLSALSDIDKWVSAYVPASAMNALDTESGRAPIEDVSQRTPPNSTAVVQTMAPGIDYDKLAAAIVRAQQGEQGN